MFKTLIYCVLLFKRFESTYAQCNPSPTTASGPQAPGQICSGDLIFEDNFDTLNFDKWSYEQTLSGGGNGAFQWYSNDPANSFVENSVLYIKPSLVTDPNDDSFLYSGSIDISDEDCTDTAGGACHRTGTPEVIINPVKSALLRTLLSFTFKYGRVEIRAKLPAGDWIWPAIWFMPANDVYGGWPLSGEIDLMEGRGNRDFTNTGGQQIGTQLMSSTLHWGPIWYLDPYGMTHWEESNAAGYDADFHNYQMNWTPDGIAFSLDDQPMGEINPPNGGFWELGNFQEGDEYVNPWVGASKMAPFDQEFYIILNSAIGSVVFFPDDAHNGAGDKPWSNWSSNGMTEFWVGRNQWLPTWELETSNNAALQIDYVRVWAI